MRYGICGGSYDPVHLGHLYIWNKAIEKLDLDCLFIIPNFISPLKTNQYFDNKIRYKLLELAINDYKELYDDNSKLVLIDYEIQKKEPSYTINTIDYLYKEYAFKSKPYFIIGSDTTHYLDKWYKIDDLVKKVNFAVIPRENYKTNLKYTNIVLDVKTFKASSTSYRENKNLDILSKRVKKYVETL